MFRLLGLMLALLMTSEAIAMPVEQPLGEGWKFRKDVEKSGLDHGWHLPGTDDRDWETTSVPNPWRGEYDGVAWYRRTVEIDPDVLSGSQAGRLVLTFGQVDDACRVYIDGRLAAVHASWNTPLYVDLTPFLAEDRASSQTIHVAAQVTDHGLEGGILKPVKIGVYENLAGAFRTDLSDIEATASLRTLGREVIYSVYVRNFSQEGTFDALRERLPEIKSLGTTLIWLLPIHEIGEAERKGPDGSPYAIRDYYSIHPALGTPEQFRQLVDAIHAHDMRIIIDCVLNHMAPDSVLLPGKIDLFHRDADGKPRADNPDWYDIVDFDWSRREVYDYCIAFMEHWVREFNIDGYRCDVADLMPDDFWQECIPRLRAIKPDSLVMLAESADARQYINGFDLTYDEGLYTALTAVIKDDAPVALIQNAVLHTAHRGPRGAAAMLFSENHDKPRAPTAFGGVAPAKAALALTALLPGTGFLYTGTEVACDDDRDATFFKVSPVDFTDDRHGMRAFTTALMALRGSRPELQSGSIEFVDASPPDRALAFRRTLGSSATLCVFNLGREAARIRVQDALLPGGAVLLQPMAWTVVSSAAQPEAP